MQLNSISLSVTQQGMRVPGGFPLVGLSNLQAILLAVQPAVVLPIWSYWGCPFTTSASLPCQQFKPQHQVDLVTE